MLPKVATHILHTTSRAAASIQHQTHTIRNVLQLQSSSGPSSSTNHLAPWNSPGSSHWGGNGAGPGGAKQNTGSRYQYNGYNGAGRAVTQANSTILSSDVSLSQFDDQEDVPTRRVPIHTAKRSRIRSHSLSTPSHGRNERGEKLGVLKTVQLHARSRHAFAPQATTSSTTRPPATSELNVSDSDPRPVLLRRNSTSAPLSTEGFDPSLHVPSPPPQAFSKVVSRSSTPHESENLSTQSENVPFDDLFQTASSDAPGSSPLALSQDTVRLIRARDTGDQVQVAEAVLQFRQTTTNPNAREFNAALEALVTTRRAGEPLNLILETYNDMLQHSVLPNFNTYILLIDALTHRDWEVQRVVQIIENRIKHRKLTGRSYEAADDADLKRIDFLRSEDNFSSAMSLFEALLSINGNKRCPPFTYANLLRSCAYHGNVEGAIHVFAHVEKRAADFLPTPSIYQHMIAAYTNAGQLQGAEQVFSEYHRAVQSEQVHIKWSKDSNDLHRGTLLVWNQMIETYFRFNLPDKAIGLVDQMMRSEPDPANRLAGPPPVGTSTFTTVLSGFCQTGDVATALVWFDRLLEQKGTSKDPFEATGIAMRPDIVAWSIMLDALAVKGMVQDVNRLFAIRLQDNAKYIRNSERMIVFAANMANLHAMDDEQLAWAIDLLRNRVVPFAPSSDRAPMTQELIDAYLTRKMYDRAVVVLSEFLNSWMDNTSQHNIDGTALDPAIHVIQSMQLEFTKKLYEATQGNVPYTVTLQLARVADRVRVTQQEEWIPFFLQSYAMSRDAGTLVVEDMALRDWELLMYAASEVENAALSGRHLHTSVPDYSFGGLISLLGDLSRHGVAFDQMNDSLIRRTLDLVLQRSGRAEMNDLFQQLGPSFQTILEDPNLSPAELEQPLSESASETTQDSGYASSETNANSKLRIDPSLTKSIHNEFKALHNPGHSALAAFAKFRTGIESGRAPSPGTTGLLIQSLGRASRMDEVRYTYTAAQAILASLETNKAWQADAWFMIEDSMVIALAHHGDVEGAHEHRTRILQQGGSPSADAYGALIYNVRDTTDDSSNALALFQESQTQRVVPNQYLYNNIISKLAKARKADYALELFQQMKASRVQPSSVTYGAVIGACARVGDVHSAEMLFSEMVQAKNFKPRVPPYNTMMQMYTTTKPDRERALHFYHELRKAGIYPTAYTYKLVMDAYGAIEPVDIHSMEQTFKALQEDKAVQIQGNHFASLINAYGCVKKDLDKAIEAFNSITTFSNVPSPDALVFEAMINALVANRRTDLIPDYMAKMKTAGVHMTAYIANFLIKGYAMVGDVERARSIFESLEDPPEGMAAPNNHIPHESSSSPVVDESSPVYREPSTWEVMIRAELGLGNRQGALDLLERLHARQYPEAVYNRISGILVDHSQVLP